MARHEYRLWETAWCPGCGNFSILDTLKKVLEELEYDPHDVLLMGGIGQAPKLPQYLEGNHFCGLHGRALPPAVAAKMVNPKLKIILNTGDGDSYGEGGNHFIHNVRRNVDITHFAHDNRLYALTKGQPSPTTSVGMTTEVQPDGSYNTPFNPLLTALSCGAGFVARGFSGKPDHLAMLMKRAIEYPGYALVDIFQNCVTFNKLHTYAWFNAHTYELDDTHDTGDLQAAMRLAMMDDERLPIGVLYEKRMPTYHDKNTSLSEGQVVAGSRTDPAIVQGLMRKLV